MQFQDLPNLGGTKVVPPSSSGDVASAQFLPKNSATINLADYQVIRRNGAVVGFEPNKISIAMTKAFLAVSGGQGAVSAKGRELVDQLTHNIVRALLRSRPQGGTFHIEDIQDQVELALMRAGEQNVARAYVLYREKRAQDRALAGQQQSPAVKTFAPIHVIDGAASVLLDIDKLRHVVVSACQGVSTGVR